MKIFKYILFLLIVSSAVLLIYQQSDQKGFRRWRTSFKIACIFAASTLGLIPINREAIEPPGNNNQVYQERLRRDQEFNSSISESSKSTLTVQGGDLGKSGPGPRAKADASRNAKAGVNQVKNSKASNSQSGGSRFAEALTTNYPTQSRPGQNKDGLFSRFPSQAKPDPYNPGCSGKPRLVKVLSVEGRPVSEQHNSDSATEHSVVTGLTQNARSEKKAPSDASFDYKEVMGELNRQSSRKKVEIKVGDQIYTIKNPSREDAYELGYKLADRIYDSIRESDTDICDIAENLGFKADNIKNVKDHVFYNEHDLDRYGQDEIEHKRFDATLEQALAWKRLEIGTFIQDDVTWIKHECAERHHELKYNSGYTEAHERAQSRFDGAPWENQF